MAGDLHTNHPIEDGLGFILGHFKTPIWPRRKSTKTNENVEWNGLNRQAPDFIFIDLDLARFKSKSKLDLDKALNMTLRNISDRPRGYPTVLWSGHGYHIYLPVEAFVLEEEKEFAKSEQPSRRFIQFAEQYLSNKKSDPCHAFTMSFKNCMLSVPGSYNSKSQPVEKVKVIQKWDGNRSSIKPLLFDFYIYLQDLKLKKIQKHYDPRREFCPYWRSNKTDTRRVIEANFLQKYKANPFSSTNMVLALCK